MPGGPQHTGDPEDRCRSRTRTLPLCDAAGKRTESGEPIERRWDARTFEKKNGPPVSFVFHVAGHRVWNFDDPWRKACVSANLLDRLLPSHGGRTRRRARAAVFQPYDITSDADQRDALSTLTAYRSTRPTASKVVSIEKNADRGPTAEAPFGSTRNCFPVNGIW